MYKNTVPVGKGGKGAHCAKPRKVSLTEDIHTQIYTYRKPVYTYRGSMWVTRVYPSVYICSSISLIELGQLERQHNYYAADLNDTIIIMIINHHYHHY